MGNIDLAEVNRLLGLLRSPDPMLRDDRACTALSDLVAGRETESRLVGHIVGQCMEALGGSLAADDRSVLGRSYSCLVLNAALEADLSRAFLSGAEWATITDAILRWWRAEPDDRGYDPNLGWVHCLAHGADTILLASQSRHADARFRSDCLRMIGQKLVATTRVFEGYEDVRCALAFSAAVFGGCADGALAQVSDVVRPIGSPAPGTGRWAAKVNLTTFLARLHVLWTVGIPPYPPGFDGSVFRPPGVPGAESLAWLTELLRRCDDFGILTGSEAAVETAGKDTI